MKPRAGWGVLVLLAAGCAHPEAEADAAPDPVHVRCVAPHAEDLVETTDLFGRAAPPPGGNLAVASQVAGRVLRLSVHEGDTVQAGKVIAIVDGSTSRDSLRQAEAEAARARAEATAANSNLSRVRELGARGIAAPAEVDEATARAEAASSAVDAAKASLDQARRTLGRVDVRASFAGTVTRVIRGPGALVDGTDATPIAQLETSSAVELVAAATESQLLRLKVGQAARVSWSNGSRETPGTVQSVPRTIDPSSGLGAVRVALSAHDEPILTGAFGQVHIESAARRAALVIPEAALRGAVSDGSEVAVCRGNASELVTVQVGYFDAQRVEVLNGLGPEDRVAIDHALGLETGTPIVEVP